MDICYIIDGYNFLFKHHDHDKALKETRNEIIQFFLKKIEELHIHVILVFDAHHQIDALKRSHNKTLEVVYTPFGQTADEYILEYLHVQKNRNDIVVTSDRHLASQIRSLKNRVIAIDNFWELLKKTEKKNQKNGAEKNLTISDAEFDYYLNIFTKKDPKKEK